MLAYVKSTLICCADATVYVGGLDDKVSEPLLWELFLQAGVVVSTHMPKVSFSTTSFKLNCKLLSEKIRVVFAFMPTKKILLFSNSLRDGVLRH